MDRLSSYGNFRPHRGNGVIFRRREPRQPRLPSSLVSGQSNGRKGTGRIGRRQSGGETRMAIMGECCTILSAPRFGISAAESDSLGGVHNELSAAVMTMVGHDLRQPLQVIMTERDILARSLSGDEERTHLTRIGRAVMQAAGTLDRLIEAVRLQEVSPRDHRQPVPLRPILADLASEFTEAAELKSIALRVVPTSVSIYSHPVLLSSMVRNLLRNAIDYTPPGGRVLVACRRRGSKAHIEVRDSGVGIAAAELTSIFNAFHRADATRADGLGLGLFIVNRAAKLLGHRVEVRSAAGQGSRFVVVADTARDEATHAKASFRSPPARAPGFAPE